MQHQCYTAGEYYTGEHWGWMVIFHVNYDNFSINNIITIFVCSLILRKFFGTNFLFCCSSTNASHVKLTTVYIDIKNALCSAFVKLCFIGRVGAVVLLHCNGLAAARGPIEVSHMSHREKPTCRNGDTHTHTDTHTDRTSCNTTRTPMKDN